MNCDLELEIGCGSAPGRYQVRVVHAVAGGEPAAELQLDVDKLLGRRDALEAAVLRSSIRARRVLPEAEQSLQEVGRALFEALFVGEVYGSYRASLGAAQERGKRLRVVLRMSAGELAALPWETLYDPEMGTYVCRQEPLVRHVPAPYTPDPLEVRAPLRILGLVASPPGLPVLDVEAEQRNLAEALAEPIADGLVEVAWISQATWSAVHGRLLAGQWHVVHFIGHGDYDTQTEQGVLALVGPTGRADLVEASRLADLLAEAQPTPRLVVLNSCSSGEVGAGDLFSGTAAALVHSGIGAVAAMQFTISDPAAIAFARGFYTALVHGRGVDEAARSGRISILGTPGTLEWVTPVLYLRGEATHLFTLTAPPVSGAPSEPRAAEEPATKDGGEPAVAIRRRAELRALYVEARAELRLEHYETAIGLLDDLLTLDPDYPQAASTRDAAQKAQRLADSYKLARDAERAGDWTVASDAYTAILELDSNYRDAAERNERCQTRQRIADLQAELRVHASAEHWQAVIDVDAELTQLDPTAADPDGLTTHARKRLRDVELERLYDEARAAEDAGDWTTASERYDHVVKIQPGYRDAKERRDQCNPTAPFERRLELVRFIHDDSVNDVAFSPDGTQIVTASGNTARVWDTGNGHEVARLTHRPVVAGVAFSPDGTQIATAGGRTARVWDRATGRELTRLNHKDLVFGVAFSPDGTQIATASFDATARLWDGATGRELTRLTHEDSVRGVTFSPDGTQVATASGRTVRIWDSADSHEVARLTHRRLVTGVAFTPDGSQIATASGRTVRVWDVRTHEQVGAPLTGHTETIVSVTFSPDGAQIATASADTVRIWITADGDQVAPVARRRAAVAVQRSDSRSGPSSAGKERENQALEFVRSRPGVTIPQIAEAMKVQPNYLYRVMPKLVADGKIRRQGTSWYPVQERPTSHFARSTIGEIDQRLGELLGETAKLEASRTTLLQGGEGKFVRSTVREIDARLSEVRQEVSRLEAARAALLGGRSRQRRTPRAGSVQKSEK